MFSLSLYLSLSPSTFPSLFLSPTPCASSFPSAIKQRYFCDQPVNSIHMNHYCKLCWQRQPPFKVKTTFIGTIQSKKSTINPRGIH
ncbi:Piso0_001936 [Millerozyma farinosa CBS 7064]|uniref:Piso0_001936 protein n=1 Tax=Pichia sorbitophila (strain ATCC MYA-4447 / BCRC 22081 / CBS 7064 / NBRC 10061 / NRRL Y-12695) TaxID=559304 RepID=G8YB92_PICSO|nr:Piso0_001936 [Millerozyma farinosa CBS 7064]